MPFEARIPAVGADGSDGCRAFGKIFDISVSNEDGRIVCEVGLCIYAEAQKNTPVSYVRDIYSTEGREIEGGERSEISYKVSLACVNGNFSGSDTVMLADLSAENGSIPMDISGVARITGVEVADGRATLSCECKYTLLMSHGAEYYTREWVCPCKYTVELRAESASVSDASDIDFEGVALPVALRCRTDGEKVQIDSEISVSVRITGKKRLLAVKVAAFEPLAVAASAEEGESCGFLICYPDKADTLWSIGKKYKKHLSALSRSNDISRSAAADSSASLENTHFLIV
jgi:hypothetical protein